LDSNAYKHTNWDSNTYKHTNRHTDWDGGAFPYTDTEPYKYASPH
jgi:hypothetical protein